MLPEIKSWTYGVMLGVALVAAWSSILSQHSAGMSYEEAAAVLCLAGLGEIVLGLIALAIGYQDEDDDEELGPGIILIGVIYSVIGAVIWFYLRCDRGSCNMPSEQEIKALIPGVLEELVEE